MPRRKNTPAPPLSARPDPFDLVRARHQRALDLAELVTASGPEAPPGPGGGVARWGDLRAALLQQMDEEERELIPFLAGVSERDVRVIIQEHLHIRDRVSDLDSAFAAGHARPSDLRDLAAVLRAHFRNEQRMLERSLVPRG